mmetsp:Transcript_27036/g.23946  ORF Transcript_27036/g.23946 Transcript_27036/m.23946 type:complete len:101 (+) Transcript_27036:93-395(+)
MDREGCLNFCMVLSCLGSGYLLFLGIMIAIDASIIHFHPTSRATSATVFIVAALIYGAIFGGILYNKRTSEPSRQHSLANWAKQREKREGKEYEMARQEE